MKGEKKTHTNSTMRKEDVKAMRGREGVSNAVKTRGLEDRGQKVGHRHGKVSLRGAT